MLHALFGNLCLSWRTIFIRHPRSRQRWILSRIYPLRLPIFSEMPPKRFMHLTASVTTRSPAVSPSLYNKRAQIEDPVSERVKVYVCLNILYIRDVSMSDSSFNARVRVYLSWRPQYNRYDTRSTSSWLDDGSAVSTHYPVLRLYSSCLTCVVMWTDTMQITNRFWPWLSTHSRQANTTT